MWTTNSFDTIGNSVVVDVNPPPSFRPSPRPAPITITEEVEDADEHEEKEDEQEETETDAAVGEQTPIDTVDPAAPDACSPLSTSSAKEDRSLSNSSSARVDRTLMSRGNSPRKRIKSSLEAKGSTSTSRDGKISSPRGNEMIPSSTISDSLQPGASEAPVETKPEVEAEGDSISSNKVDTRDQNRVPTPVELATEAVRSPVDDRNVSDIASSREQKPTDSSSLLPSMEALIQMVGNKRSARKSLSPRALKMVMAKDSAHQTSPKSSISEPSSQSTNTENTGTGNKVSSLSVQQREETFGQISSRKAEAKARLLTFMKAYKENKERSKFYAKDPMHDEVTESRSPIEDQSQDTPPSPSCNTATIDRASATGMPQKQDKAVTSPTLSIHESPNSSTKKKGTSPVNATPKPVVAVTPVPALGSYTYSPRNRPIAASGPTTPKLPSVEEETESTKSTEEKTAPKVETAVPKRPEPIASTENPPSKRKADTPHLIKNGKIQIMVRKIFRGRRGKQTTAHSEEQEPRPLTTAFNAKKLLPAKFLKVKRSKPVEVSQAVEVQVADETRSSSEDDESVEAVARFERSDLSTISEEFALAQQQPRKKKSRESASASLSPIREDKSEVTSTMLSGPNKSVALIRDFVNKSYSVSEFCGLCTPENGFYTKEMVDGAQAVDSWYSS